jgi:putative endonuclease
MQYTKDDHYTVYVLEDKKGLLYKGVTNCLDYRLFQHNNNLGNWTKNRGPFKLVYTEKYKIKTDALKREKYLKSGKGREFLKSTLLGE